MEKNNLKVHNLYKKIMNFFIQIYNLRKKAVENKIK